MSTLILIESPNKVEAITKYAKAAGIEPVKVMATVGHILDLPPMNEGLGIDLTTWEPVSLVPRDDHAASRISKIQAAIKDSDKVLVATDNDREGEGIADEVWDWIPKGKARRCLFDEITPAGIARGLGALRDIDRNKVEAAKARRALDRLVGHSMTQASFQKLPDLKTSAGRVQSPTARLVVDRDREVSAFKPVAYFTIGLRLRHTDANGTQREFSAKVLRENKFLSFKEQSEAKELSFPEALSCLSAEGREKEQKPKAPFKNSTWLQVAQKALKMPVGKASEAIQALFDKGSTTYPRTDSVRADEESIAWAREELARRFGPEYVPAQPWQHKDKAGAQGAHECIRPTVPHDKPREHEPAFEEAFKLIEGRFLASQAAPRRVQETVLRFTAPEGYQVEAKGLVELFPGWKKVLQLDPSEEEGTDPEPGTKGAEEDAEEEGSLPPVKEGDQVEVLEVLVQDKFTKAPSPFTQASLVDELDRRGIGRPSTFTSMVMLVMARAYVGERAATGSRKKKGDVPFLAATEIGFRLVDLLVIAFPEFLDYEFTAKIEEGLDKIEGGKLERTVFLATIWKRLETAIEGVKAIPAQRQPRKEFGPCPTCQAAGRDGHLVLKKGKRKDSGEAFEFAGCSLDTKESKPCGYRADTENGELKAQVPCPSCKKPMRGVNRKDGGHSLVCEEHGWHLASKSWELVKSQHCPSCMKPMQHHPRKDGSGHFWACFDCKKFLDSDTFGAIVKPKRKVGAKVKAPKSA